MKSISLYKDNGTWLCRVHPFTKLMYIAAVILIPLFLHTLWAYAVAIALDVAILISGKSLKRARALIIFSFTIIATIFLIKGLFDGDNIPFGTKILFQNDLNHHEILASEICEDGWAIFSPSSLDANMGATIIFNLSASNETLNKESTRRTLVSEASRKLCASYVYTSASFEESTTDLLFSGHNIISECGDILEESPLFEPSMIVQSIDLERIINRRRNQNTFFNDNLNGFIYVHYQAPRAERKEKIYRTLSKFPFVYNDFSLKMVNLDKVIKMQSLALARRLKAINCDKVVLGLSGGLDSTLAFLVIQETFAFLKFDSKNIHVITMPCFGTSKRTHQNALKLAEAFNNTFKEINISDEVNLHLNDINYCLF